MTYNSWPLGKIPKEYQRPEIQQLKDAGYEFNDPIEILDIFEKKIAEYTGAPYAVSVDNCTDALFLCLYYLKHTIETIGKHEWTKTITIPSKTYISVPQSILQASYKIKFKDISWSGMYQLEPLHLYDSAARFTKNMYIPNSCMTLSFQIKKRIPIGKGGMILTGNEGIYNWCKKARYEGRDLSVSYDKDNFNMMGWNMYMCPEDCARGILLFDKITDCGKNEFDDMWGSENYPDLIEKNVLVKWGYK